MDYVDIYRISPLSWSVYTLSIDTSLPSASWPPWCMCAASSTRPLRHTVYASEPVDHVPKLLSLWNRIKLSSFKLQGFLREEKATNLEIGTRSGTIITVTVPDHRVQKTLELVCRRSLEKFVEMRDREAPKDWE